MSGVSAASVKPGAHGIIEVGAKLNHEWIGPSAFKYHCCFVYMSYLIIKPLDAQCCGF